MKRLQYIYSLWMLCGVLGSFFPNISAQNYVGVSVSGDLTHTLENLSFTHTQISGGTELGFVYEYHKRHFVLQTGLQYALQCPAITLDSQFIAQNMVDTRGINFTYRGILDQRTDRLTINQLIIPVALGGTWKGVSAMAGVKICATLAASSYQTAQLKTKGDYNGRYYEELENMPNHGYHDFEPVDTKQNVKLRPLDIRLFAEIGYGFELKKIRFTYGSPLFKVGIYVEGGILNLHNTDYTDPLTVPYFEQYMNVTMNHVYTSAEANDSPAHLMCYGLRLTLLFPVSGVGSSNSHYPCRCYCP